MNNYYEEELLKKNKIQLKKICETLNHTSTLNLKKIDYINCILYGTELYDSYEESIIKILKKFGKEMTYYEISDELVNYIKPFKTKSKYDDKIGNTYDDRTLLKALRSLYVKKKRIGIIKTIGNKNKYVGNKFILI